MAENKEEIKKLEKELKFLKRLKITMQFLTALVTSFLFQSIMFFLIDLNIKSYIAGIIISTIILFLFYMVYDKR